MTTVRIHALVPNHGRLFPTERKEISEVVREVSGGILLVDSITVEVFWYAPIEQESSENTLNFWLDAMTDVVVPVERLEAWAEELIEVFERYGKLGEDEYVGVYVMTQYTNWFWRDNVSIT